jgi:hypothetical protein
MWLTYQLLVLDARDEEGESDYERGWADAVLQFGYVAQLGSAGGVRDLLDLADDEHAARVIAFPGLTFFEVLSTRDCSVPRIGTLRKICAELGVNADVAQIAPREVLLSELARAFDGLTQPR